MKTNISDEFQTGIKAGYNQAIEEVEKMIDNRKVKNIITRKAIPKNCQENKREVAIRQVQGRILELGYIKQKLEEMKKK